MDDKIINTPLGLAYIPPKEILDMENTAIRGHMYEDMRISAKLSSEQFPNGLNGELLKMYTTIVKSCDIPTVLDMTPEELQTFNIAVATSPGFSTTQLNLALNQLSELPDASIQQFKQAVLQNRSKLRDAAEAGLDTASDLIEQVSRHGIDTTFEFPEFFSELVSYVDDSIELVENHAGVTGIAVTILTFFLLWMRERSNAKLSEQRHFEDMQEKQKQTHQLELQTEYLEQIAKNTAPDNTEDTSKNITR